MAFVSRGGLKLRHALDVLALSPRELRCADLGCSTGGFTDCLLQAGAARVHAVDTGFGVLAWKLRQDPRVVVHERRNALHLDPPEPVDLVVIDLGWTPQRLCIPAALRWLAPAGRVLSLIKPHYEDKPLAEQHRGILPDALAESVALRVLDAMPALGVRVLAHTRSPIRGSAGSGEGRGNHEWLALLQPA
ncbi:MAG: SAM-dependent methyltransferase [Phycisphaerales bacterium]